MRVIGGIVLGLALFFPGITLLQWIAEDLLGQQMTITDGCLVMIIILLSIIIVTRLPRDQTQEQSRPRVRRDMSAAGQQPAPYSPPSVTTTRRPRPRRPADGSGSDRYA